MSFSVPKTLSVLKWDSIPVPKTLSVLKWDSIQWRLKLALKFSTIEGSSVP